MFWEWSHQSKNIPSMPNKSPSKDSTAGDSPAIEKLGLMESGFPTQTVPMTDRTRPRSAPIPHTWKDRISIIWVSRLECCRLYLHWLQGSLRLTSNFRQQERLCRADETTYRNDSIMRYVTMVCQSIQTGTGTTLVSRCKIGRYEAMFTGNYYLVRKKGQLAARGKRTLDGRW